VENLQGLGLQTAHKQNRLVDLGPGVGFGVEVASVAVVAHELDLQNAAQGAPAVVGAAL